MVLCITVYQSLYDKYNFICRSNSIPCAWESEFSPWTQDEDMCSPLVCSTV